MGNELSARAMTIAQKVEDFVRGVVGPYESDPRRDHHGNPTDGLAAELKSLARKAGILTPHILHDGAHLDQRETAVVLKAAGLSPLGMLACNVAAPDEGNMSVGQSRQSCAQGAVLGADGRGAHTVMLFHDRTRRVAGRRF